MTPVAAFAGFLLAAGLLTVTPGLDTMLVLRTAAGEGRRAAVLGACGISLGTLLWGGAVALGLGALLATAPLAYGVLTWAGAGYLAIIGVGLLLRPRRHLTMARGAAPHAVPAGAAAVRRGLLTNLLNPKIGVFYVSFLPQFVPPGWPAGPVLFALAATHAAIGLAWLWLLAAGVGRMRPWLERGAVVGWLDRVTGAVFIGFGLRLVLGRPA